MFTLVILQLIQLSSKDFGLGVLPHLYWYITEESRRAEWNERNQCKIWNFREIFHEIPEATRRKNYLYIIKPKQHIKSLIFSLNCRLLPHFIVWETWVMTASRKQINAPLPRRKNFQQCFSNYLALGDNPRSEINNKYVCIFQFIFRKFHEIFHDFILHEILPSAAQARAVTLKCEIVFPSKIVYLNRWHFWVSHKSKILLICLKTRPMI